MKKTYHGSCHCGSVRFECELDLQAGTSKCNCSMCAKTRFWKAIVAANEFRLLEGEKSLSDYQFGSRTIHHLYCSRCGVKPFGRATMEPIGAFYAVNVACLDDVSPQELAEAPVQFEDGRHDRWDRAPEETRTL